MKWIKYVSRTSYAPEYGQKRTWYHNVEIFGTLYDINIRKLIFRKSEMPF